MKPGGAKARQGSADRIAYGVSRFLFLPDGREPHQLLLDSHRCHQRAASVGGHTPAEEADGSEESQEPDIRPEQPLSKSQEGLKTSRKGPKTAQIYDLCLMNLTKLQLNLSKKDVEKAPPHLHALQHPHRKSSRRLKAILIHFCWSRSIK